MRVSVVIPVYNNARLIEETLATIYAQAAEGVEIVAVDDGSTDETAAVLQRHAGRLRHFREENSGGCSRPRNYGIKESRGEHIAIFDSDDLMMPAKLERQSAFLDRHPEVDFVFTDFVNFEGDREGEPHSHSCPRFRRALAGRRVEPDGYILPAGEAYEILLEENYIGASTMMFRRGLVEKIGGFNETYDSSEDREFALRVTRAGEIGFLDFIGHRRRIHGASMSAQTEKVLTRKIRLFEEEGRIVRGNHRIIVRRRLSQLHLALGWHLRERGRAKEGLAHYRRAIALRPLGLRAYAGLGRCLVRALRPPFERGR
ncbi:MAG: glycosyltransferase [Candidatus Eisenbacteria bacterium]